MLVRDSRASQLQSCRQRIALFKGLQVDNYEDRACALEKIIQVVKSYIRSSLSPITTSPTLSDHSVTDHTIQCEDDEYSKQLFYFLLTILRLSISCPYADVRQTFKHLLIGLKVRIFYFTFFFIFLLMHYFSFKKGNYDNCNTTTKI